MTFYDIHTHILFGVDDGAFDYDISCQMIKMAYKEGIRHMCATPHYNRKSSADSKRPERIQAAFRRLQSYIGEEYPGMFLYPGNEVMYYTDMIHDLDEGRIMTLNHSCYVLVEFKPSESYRVVYNALQQILHRRYIPVLAHIERLECLYGRWERLNELKEANVILQMNTSSMIGNIFSSKVRYCRKLVENEYVDVLGTDMHNVTNRAPRYREAADWIKVKCGRERMLQLVEDNPKAILENRMIE